MYVWCRNASNLKTDERGFAISYSAKAKPICRARWQNPNATQMEHVKCLLLWSVVALVGPGLGGLCSLHLFLTKAPQTNCMAMTRRLPLHSRATVGLVMGRIRHFDHHTKGRAGNPSKLLPKKPTSRQATTKVDLPPAPFDNLH